MDEPTVAIPLRDEDGTVRLIRAFSLDDEGVLVISIDLQRRDGGRNRPTVGAVGQVKMISAPSGAAEEQLREILESSYLQADPNWRDRILRADGEEEPIVLVVGDWVVTNEVAAVAATFGMTIEPLAANLARDPARLKRVLGDLGGLLAAAIFWETDTDSLVWVADLVASLTRPDLPRRHLTSSPGPGMRTEVRRELMAMSAGTLRPTRAVTVETCARCQPTVSRTVAEYGLDVDTVAADAPGGCVCGGGYSESHSIRLSLGAQLAEISSVLVIGHQQNFTSAMSAAKGAEFRHINNAGKPDTAAQRAEIAVIITGSVMGHSDSQPYVDAVIAKEVPLARTSNNQLSDLSRTLLEEAVRRRPQLRRS
jgi:hypothetical protein